MTAAASIEPAAANNPGDTMLPDIEEEPSTLPPANNFNEVEPPSLPSTSRHENDKATTLNERQQTIQTQRTRARDGLLQQAEKMIKRSRVLHQAGNPGDNVTVSIPLVDRGRGDPRNIMGVIIDRDCNDMYRIAVRAGLLEQKYSRNQFDLCTQKLLSLSDVRQDREVLVRVAVHEESKCGDRVISDVTAGYRCKSNRCKCFKANVKCNSRCHSSLTCRNKCEEQTVAPQSP